MKNILSDSNFDYVGQDDRAFLIAFDKKMCNLGYARTEIGDFHRWGNYTVAYIKPKVKTKTYISKIFFDGTNISLRLYLRKIDKHSKYIENVPKHIKEAFVNDYGKCQRCSDGSCRHRKIYTIDGITYEKCDGKVFYFNNFDMKKLNDYISIVKQFYPVKRKSEIS